MAEQQCVRCARPAYIFCENCVKVDEDTGRPLNTNCFSKDDRESLLKRAHRAGELAQMVFYAFIAHTWAYDMSDIVIIPDQHGEIRALEVTRGPGNDNGPGGKSTCQQQAGGWLYKIPSELFKSAAEQRAKHMLLADQHSVWMFMNMHSVVQTIFKDLIKDAKDDIKEVAHYLPVGTRRLIRHKDSAGLQTRRNDLPYPDLDAQGDLKGVYRITLKNDTQIALDLAGAQYDLAHNTVEPWLPYLQRSASQIKYRVAFCSHRMKHMDFMKDYNNTTHLTIVLEQLTSLNSMLSTYKDTYGCELKDLLDGDDEHFLQNKKDFETAVTACLQRRINEIDGDNPMCTVAPFDLRHPKVIAQMEKAAAGESTLFDFGDMRKFDWSKLSDMIKMPGDYITYAEKKRAKNLLQHRCVYKMLGDWRLVFLEKNLPSDEVPEECISVNQKWKRK